MAWYRQVTSQSFLDYILTLINDAIVGLISADIFMILWLTYT